MARVEIIDTPPGQAPEWVRQAWINIVLPVVSDDEEKGIQMGALGGLAENGDGYRVRAIEALELLEESSIDAAEYWYDLFGLYLPD